ncbi:uncharacterized protein LOC130784173 isoform X2 [Actinidia eriantha]|uniref:uncharacterized protein LOC130784173 isoform X2 n=1 Tax=Actinidia eriantha TaxID=165200 RepID=UPI002588FAC9|nr:uncharacterized protein LOC130784173 isoform X2 [Actinidia eriantha]
MDPDSLGNTTRNAPRKVRFAPKVPQRKVQVPVVPKTEKIETVIDEDAQAKDLLRRFNEASVKVKPKSEKKAATAQVAFGYGGGSTFIKSYGAPKNGIGTDSCEGLRAGKEYKEPWDYYSNYPVTLPLRRPYSGNPELLDEEEFGEAAKNLTYDEDSTKAASELGLMEENPEASMFFLQLPAKLPIVKQSPKSEGPQTAGSANPADKSCCSLDELPAGFMGKMLVYKSGAVKLKLGDTIYDVSAGSNCIFAQDVVAINAEEKHCCSVGELGKRVIITPDVDSLLDRMSDLE